MYSLFATISPSALNTVSLQHDEKVRTRMLKSVFGRDYCLRELGARITALRSEMGRSSITAVPTTELAPSMRTGLGPKPAVMALERTQCWGCQSAGFSPITLMRMLTSIRLEPSAETESLALPDSSAAICCSSYLRRTVYYPPTRCCGIRKLRMCNVGHLKQADTETI